VVARATGTLAVLLRQPDRPGPVGLDAPRMLSALRQPEDVATDPSSGTAYAIGRAGAQTREIPARAFGPR
jgi:hypothetical protein